MTGSATIPYLYARRPGTGQKGMSEMATTVIPVSDDYWADRIHAAETDDELMATAWSYLLSTLAHGFPTTPERRNARRRQVAELLIRAAEQP